ncbi:MAG: hypothetical protein ACR2LA_02975 [Acidimicrobiales bacterium]
MTTNGPPPEPQPPPTEAGGGTSRRSWLAGAGLAALTGAGAGFAGSELLRADPAPARPLLAAGSVAGGDRGPWHYVEPGGSVQATIDGGAKAIQLGDGTYEVAEAIVPTAGCVIRGIGQRTRLVATAEMAAMIAIGNGGPIDGVQVADLVLACGDKADVGIDLDIIGTDGNFQDEPDAVCRLDDLWVFDAGGDGIVYRGTDTQACTSSRIRVRRARRYGYRIEAPDNVWIACEGTSRDPDGAGFYVGTAVGDSNGIGAGNVHFHACKAWYCGGIGWHVTGSRSSFVGCESQDTGGHGWLIETPRNTFASCAADTAAMADVGGKADSADGFHVIPGEEMTMVACMAFDRGPGGLAPQQRYGFDVPASLVESGLLVGHTGWGNVKGLVHRR